MSGNDRPDYNHTFRKNNDGSVTISVPLPVGYHLAGRGGTVHWSAVNDANNGYPVASLNLPRELQEAIGPAAMLDCEITIRPRRPGGIQL